MITKVTKDNKALYRALFEKVNEDLGYQGNAQITSLDQFFSSIEQIAGKNLVYTVLPLDEPTFDIDANSRVIAVPEEFRKNGISVQGDQVSEIIYFTIDRYVDAMDLYRDDIQIVIQWETAPATSTSSKTAKTEKGISLAYLKDVSLFKSQGKMLFGWALNNTITQTAGIIKFSVRFYKLNGAQELDFSLSTLTAQATINPGLDYTWQGGQWAENWYDNSQLIQSRIKDSVQPDDVGFAEEPEFLADFLLPHEFNITRKEMVDGELQDVTYKAIDLIKTVSDDNTVFQRDLVVQATGDGYISYKWKRKDLNTLNEIPLEIKDILYIPTADTVFSGEKLYYTKKTVDGVDNYSIFTVAPGDVGKTIEDKVEPDTVLYERVSHCLVEFDPSNPPVNNVTGIYTVTAKNKVGLASATKDDYVLIPGPEKETFEIEMPEGQSDQVYLTDGLEGTGTTTLRILGKTARVTDEANNIVGDTIVYTWDEQEPVEAINITNATPNEFTISGIPVEERALYDKTVTVEVHAFRNGEVSESKTQSYRITDAAHAPEVSIGEQTTGSKNVRLKSAAQTAILEANVDNFADIKHDGDGDSVSYEWYKVVADEGDEFIASNDDLLVDTDEKCVTITDGKCQLAFRPDHITLASTGELAGQGLYYCVVKNTVNGSFATNDVSQLTLDDCISITIAD